MSTKRPTMADVAQAAGVSRATVSFVLNNAPGQTIPDDTRQRVLRAAQELGYRPHSLARALRSGSSRIVLLDTGNMPHFGILDAYIAGLSAGVEAAGHHLLVSPSSATTATAQEAIEAVRPAGVITLRSLHLGDELPATLEVAREMTSHLSTPLAALAQAGHRSVAVVHPGSPRDPFIARMLEHARDAAGELGLTIARELPQEELDAALALDASGLGGATAVLGLTDSCALAVLAAAHDAGVAVPARLSVIGFGDTAEASSSRPRLTTATLAAASFGTRAAQRLLGLPEDPVPFPASWVVPGETVGPPPR